MLLILGQKSNTPEMTVEVIPEEELEQVAFLVRLTEEMGDAGKDALNELASNPNLTQPIVMKNENGMTIHYCALKEPLSIPDYDRLCEILHPYLDVFGAHLSVMVYSHAKEAIVEFFLVPEHYCDISEDGSMLTMPDFSSLPI